MAGTGQGDRRGESLVGGTPFDLGAAQTGKPKARVPEILLGTFLVALFALAGAWFYSTSTESDRYVALAADVQRGQEIESADLVFVDIATEATILKAVRDSELDAVVGKLAVVDMEAGTLITPGQFAERSVIPQGQGVVGVVVDPGQYPTFELRAGDWVRVVAVYEGPDGAVVEPATLINPNVEILEIAQLEGDNRFVSLLTDVETADVIANTEDDDEVTLILVPEADPDRVSTAPAETSAGRSEEADESEQPEEPEEPDELEEPEEPEEPEEEAQDG